MSKNYKEENKQEKPQEYDPISAIMERDKKINRFAGLGARKPHQEIIDILKAFFAITLAFAIVLRPEQFTWIGFLIVLGISALTVGIGFVFHEMMHRYFARKYKCHAEFRSFDVMLIAAVLMSFVGFVFAAPGAVFIRGNISKKHYGIVSLAGPLSNLILGIIFFGLTFVVSANSAPFLVALFTYGFVINTWLAMFNMLPLFNLDGKKILDWNGWIWTIVFVAAIALYSTQYWL